MRLLSLFALLSLSVPAVATARPSRAPIESVCAGDVLPFGPPTDEDVSDWSDAVLANWLEKRWASYCDAAQSTPVGSYERKACACHPEAF